MLGTQKHAAQATTTQTTPPTCSQIIPDQNKDIHPEKPLLQPTWLQGYCGLGFFRELKITFSKGAPGSTSFLAQVGKATWKITMGSRAELVGLQVDGIR